MAGGKTGALLAGLRRDRRGAGRRAGRTRRRAARRTARSSGWPSSWSTTCSASGATRRSPASRCWPTCGPQEVAAGHLRAGRRRRGRRASCAGWLRQPSRPADGDDRGRAARASPGWSRRPAAGRGPPAEARAASCERAPSAGARTAVEPRAPARAAELTGRSRRLPDATARADDRSPPSAPAHGRRPAHPDAARSRSTRGRRPPARPAGRRGLVEGRARDQRDDGRRGPAAARVPRHPRPTRRPPRPPAGSARSSATTAPGPPSTAGPATCPPRSRPRSRCGWPATRRRAAHARARPRSSATAAASSATRVFTRIWLALFGLWSWDDAARRCRRRSMLLPPLGAAQHLRLRLLGPADDRAAHRRRRACARCGRCRSASTSCAPAPPRRADAALDAAGRASSGSTGCCTRYERHPVRPLRRRAVRTAARVDPRPPGGRRLAGAASSRRGSTRCSRCTCSATRSTTRVMQARRSPASTASWSARRRPTASVRRLEACQSPVWDTGARA